MKKILILFSVVLATIAGAAPTYQTIDPAVPSGLIQKIDDNFDASLASWVSNDAALATQAAANALRTDLLDTGLTAGTTQTQAGGLALVSEIDNVTIVGTDNDAVTLPTASEGLVTVIFNSDITGDNILQVFPFLGDDLGEGVNASITIDAGQFGVFRCIDATNIISVVSQPSNAVSLHTGNGTLTRAQMSNGHTNYVNAAATLTMIAADANTNFNVITIGAVAVSVDSFATDLIYLDGVALDDADKISNLTTAGDLTTIKYFDATGTYAATNSWTDGGA